MACLPTRADTAAVYRMVRTGNVFADDLQPLFATAGPENTGKTLASLTALEQLGLIERRGARYQPVEVTGKDLSSAPVLAQTGGRGRIRQNEKIPPRQEGTAAETGLFMIVRYLKWG